MDGPLDGFLRIPERPLHDALAHTQR
jgi:hypothetical protein